MTVKLAKYADGIPVVTDATDRDGRFPTPDTNQRVHNLATASIERYDGAVWVIVFDAPLTDNLTLTNRLTIEGSNPRLVIIESDAAADNQRWDMVPFEEAMLYRVMKDDGSGGTTYMQIDRTLNVIDKITLSGPVQVATFGANDTTPIAKPTISGSRGGNAALANLLTALANYGLITDNTS